MSKVTLSGHIVVLESELASVRDALPMHIEATRAEEGCIVFDVEEHATELGRFDVYEEFATSGAFRYHQKRVKESDWGALTQNVTRHYTIEGFDGEKSQ